MLVWLEGRKEASELLKFMKIFYQKVCIMAFNSIPAINIRCGRVH